jgi:hypothetical protein
MKNIVQLSRTGGSLAFHVSKILKKERLDWKKGEYFSVSADDKNQITITRLDLKKMPVNGTLKTKKKYIGEHQ